MKFFSTNKKAPVVDFREATIKGQPDDKGLYFPGTIPMFSQRLLDNLISIPDHDIAFEVIKPYVGECIPENDLYEIVRETLSFPIPLKPISDRIYSLELFHGPTLAFKDVGARFMSRCLRHFVKDRDKKLTVLVATSGDTGGAVANGFYDVEGIDVVILYPSGKVSPVQEKQLTALGKNIHAIEITGSFDDCQALVKQAFADKEVNEKIFLTSANSINVARWLPQQFYYLLAYKQWPDKSIAPVISVPSGNFGNICAGILAHRSGMPVSKFIAACNRNDTIPEYLATGLLPEKKAVATLSNAMDVANPSNFVRILELFHQQLPELKQTLVADSITDEETLDTIDKVDKQYHYLLDPHGAVGYLALDRFLSKNPSLKGIVLETAHPVKFPNAIEKIIGGAIELPESVLGLMQKEKQAIKMLPDYEGIREFLIRNKK